MEALTERRSASGGRQSCLIYIFNALRCHLSKILIDLQIYIEENFQCILTLYSSPFLKKAQQR